MQRSLTSLFSAAAVLSALSLSGCAADLDAVGRFARTSAATAEYQQVVKDYVDSPNRQRSYQPERFAQQLTDLAHRRAAQKPRLEAAQKVLVQYMKALGELADDHLPDVDDEIGDLGSALASAKFVGDGDAQVGKETATAATAIAKVLGRAVLDHYRQSAVVTIVRETDPHLQTLLAGLSEVLDKDLRSSLENEAVAVSKPFKAWIAASTSANDPDGAPPVARILMEERLEEIRARVNALDAYLRVLDTIGRGHADLRANVNKLTEEALAGRLKGYAKELQKLQRSIFDLQR